MKARGVGRWTRWGIALQVLVAVVLSTGAAVLVVNLSEWKYFRFDLSAGGRNTVDDTLLELIENLPQKAEVDVFFRPLQPPFHDISRRAHDSVFDLLAVIQNSERARIDVEVYDPRDLERTQARRQALGVEGMNVIVVSCGEARATLDLFRDLVDVDWGNPTNEWARYLIQEGILVLPDPQSPPRRPGNQLLRVRAGEALGEALLKVSSGKAPRVYFSVGHGEPSLDNARPEDANELGKLRLALEQDGFAVGTWEAAAVGPVPDDCDVLVLVGAEQPFPADQLAHVHDYVTGGGRLLAAPSYQDFDEEVSDLGGAASPDSDLPEGIAGFLRRYGMLPQAGVVCEELTNSLGQRVAGVDAAGLTLNEQRLSSSHPITIPLRRHAQYLSFSRTFSFGRGGVPGGGSLEDLISTGTEAWRDLRDPATPGRPRNWRFDRGREERGRWSLCKVAYLRGAGTGLENEGRILGIASAGFLGNGLFTVNRDFLLNSFNWLAERDHRVQVRPREFQPTLLDVERGHGLAILTYVLWLGLPGACIAVGIVLAWRRRRGRRVPARVPLA